MGADVSPWPLDRTAVADRLDELVAEPGRIRQGTLNLCGPAAVFKVWLERDPVAAATYAAKLFEEGAARIGPLAVRPSPSLLRARHDAGQRPADCPQADWMMMAALRDSTNRIWRYSRQGGLREGMAAMTLPGALSNWLSRDPRGFTRIRDETSLVLRKGTDHATRLAPRPDREAFLLVASEMFRRPQKRLRRTAGLRRQPDPQPLGDPQLSRGGRSAWRVVPVLELGPRQRGTAGPRRLRPVLLRRAVAE